ACVVVLDNTEYARNGDYPPNRFEAQTDTIPIIISSKQQLNQENSVGIMTMGGQQVEVLVTPNKEGKATLFECLSNILASIKTQAKQELKIQEEEKQLNDIAKQLKKNKVSVDVINMYQNNENQVQKLQKFIETVNSGDTSHFLNVESGQNITDILISSPILNVHVSSQGGVQGEQGVAPGQFDEYGGVDPEKDPELAMAIKQSLDEEKRRREQEQQQQQQQQPQQQLEEKNIVQNNNQMEEERHLLAEEGGDMEDEEELLRKAMEESMKPNPLANQENKKEDEKYKGEGADSSAQIQKNLLENQEFIDDLLKMVQDQKPEKKKDDKDQKK
ncbi:hypothetical protein IMG5_147140, partial [Ichthyophthirius multifiliis]